MAFEPTHVVPSSGMQAWSEPDPAKPPSAQLAAGTELRAVEQLGQWSKVEGSNGWTGWVDGNLLVARAPVTTAAVPPPPPPPGVGPTLPTTMVTGEVGMPRSLGVSILLAVVTLGIYTYVWVYKNHEEVKRYSGIGVGGILGFLVYFVLAPVTFFLLPSEVKQLYEREGQASPVEPLWGLWFLLPLIGSLIWYVRVQNAINDFWAAKGAPRP